MNPTLISGFEDVITHINQQEQRVMGLEEENKKLKADIKKFQEENEKLGAEIKKFQEENEKLEAKVLRLQSSEQDLEKKLDTGGWSPTSSIEPKQ